MSQLSQHHIGGVEFFRLPDLKSLNIEEYFNCLQKMLPLLRDKDFIVSTPAFYINYITNPDDNANSLRLTYFTVDPARSIEIIHDFIQDHQNIIALFNSVWTSRPFAETQLEMPNDEEIKFRNFLNDNTKIALDIVENSDRELFRKMICEYRHVDLPNKIPPKNIFADLLEQSSPYFQELKKQNLEDQYWKDLLHLFHGSDFGLHFLVNMMAVEEAPYKREFFQEGWISH